MKKNNQNLQAAESFLASHNKEDQEKIEFIKTHGKFFRNVLTSLEHQVEKHRFILNSFHRSAIQLPDIYKTNSQSKETGEIEQTREWSKLSELQNIKQRMSQEQMETVCKSIAADAASDDSHLLEYVIIDFNKGRFTWQDMTFLLSHVVIDIEVSSVDTLENLRESYYLPLGGKLNGTIYMCAKDNSVEAFLKAIGDDGKEYFFELSHFSMLFLLDEDHRDMDESKRTFEGGSKETAEPLPVEDEKESREVGMFTLFDGTNNLLFVTTY